MRTTASKIVVAIIIIVGGLLCAAWMQNEQAKKRTWEYKHMALSSALDSQYEKTLNQQGTEGWELIAADREQPGGLVHFYFKRAK